MTQSEQTLSALDAIYQRRSVRAYTGEVLDRNTIDTLLLAAVQAPTAIHQEPWVFVVLQDRVVLQRLSDRGKALFVEEAQRAHLDRGGHVLEMFSQPEFNIFYQAGTLIVICGRPMGPFVVADCWLAAENLMLAACAMGLGSCVIGSAVTALNTPEAKAELGIPAELTAIAPIVVGVPSGVTPPVPRKAPEIVVWK